MSKTIPREENPANFIAIDLGASSGRLMLGQVLTQETGQTIELSELHRFVNEPVSVNGSVHWDVLRLWHEIKIGLSVYAKNYSDSLQGISVDTWGVDFALLDKAGNLLGNPYHYRDHRTDGWVEKSFETMSRSQIYERTGIQFMQINSLYQLLSMVDSCDPQLELADTLLITPDLFNYWLSGQKVVEYTNASTSQLVNAQNRQWDTKLIETFKIPLDIFPKISKPMSKIGTMQTALMTELGFNEAVPIIATGSHDTANAVAAVPNLDNHSAYISSGTWSLIGTELQEPILSEAALRLNFSNEGGVANTIRFLKNVMGLWLLQESRRQWQREGREYDWHTLLTLAQEAEAFKCIIDPDADEFLGHGDIPAHIRAFCKRTNQPIPETDAQIIRCCLESLALRYRWVIEALEDLTGNNITTIRIVGGGIQNTVLNQFTANACNRTVVTGPIEATAFGNIMLQAVTTGHITSLETGREVIANSIEQEVFEPQSNPQWDVAFTKFKQILG